MKVMLAPSKPVQDLSKLKFPLMASPKIDGVRAIVVDGVVMSRNMKPIPNPTVQKMFGHLEGLDGELVVGSPTHPNCMQNTMSGVMRHDGYPLVTWHVFDSLDVTGKPFKDRLTRTAQRVKNERMKCLKVVAHRMVATAASLEAYEQECLEKGYEGVMIRDPEGPYKQGRVTHREGWMLKLKRYADGEAVVIGFEEEMHNANPAKRNAAGKLERSSHKANKVGKGRLGALICYDPKLKVEFNVHGFIESMKHEIWQNQDKYINKIITYKYLPHGMKDAPRHPTFKAFRDPIDL